jgi:purine-binding chemotaxis protein CheW
MSQEAILENTLYLIFKLNRELFSIDVPMVREVLDLPTITRIPKAPPYLRGVINVRGNVVPVVDLRIRFGFTETPKTVNTRVIVMELPMDDEQVIIGAVADSVHDVQEITASQIEPPPKIGRRWQAGFIKGIGKQNEQFIMIIDADKVFSSDMLSLTGEVECDTNQEKTTLAEVGAA